jgi:hypothetical protein
MTKKQLREAIRRIIAQELNEATMWEPAIADPAIADPDIETEEDDDDLIIGNPNVKPNPQAEKKIIQKIIARYKTSLNEKKK